MAQGHALLTGALGGLGTAMTAQLRADGIEVIATDRRAEDAEAWLAQFDDAARAGITFHALDVLKEEQFDDLARDLEFRGIHVAYLINNAGIVGPAKVWAQESRIWHRVIGVNLDATFYATRAFSKPMVDRGFGRIVNLASLNAYQAPPETAAYSAAKAAVTGYTRSTARDLARYGITVNAIAPGLIWHERLAGVLPDSVWDATVKETPARRAGKPEEIAATVAFLLSEGAGYITGQTIHVNGGLYMPG